MLPSFEKAIDNVVKHGDTDIFPLPIENHIIFDKRQEVVKLLMNINGDLKKWITDTPPYNEGVLAPISYSGFRWATQIDPLWNLYFLGLVISIADQIEERRIPKEESRVFSYRYLWDENSKELFDRSYDWRAFMRHSMEQAAKANFVLTCDISEFYPRLGHHRLDNALRHLGLPGDTHKHIISFLSNFSGTNSFGLPVGGPAARILSEITLDQIDQLLRLQGVNFCRFADDFHIFCVSREDAYNNLLNLSEKLHITQGLQLQKSKTRIMSSAEFLATSPMGMSPQGDGEHPTEEDDLQADSRRLLQFSLRFDPYSETADEDYELLKREVSRLNIIGLLQSELSKSRVHVAVARKIVNAIQFLSQKQKEAAVESLFDNTELLYPILSSVLSVTRAVFPEVSSKTQDKVIRIIIELIESGSHVLRVELNLAYAVRLLGCKNSSVTDTVLAQLYGRQNISSLIRRDIILIMAKWGSWGWLSSLRGSFRTMTPSERRAYIIASYSLGDEGRHWRDHIKGELSPFEEQVRIWRGEKANQPNWNIPI